MKDELLASASLLKQPSPKSREEFSGKHEELAEIGNANMAKRDDAEKLVGTGNQAMAADNNRNFARFMDSLFSAYKPEVFVETVLWVFRSYRNHGFKSIYWAANLDIWVENLKVNLSDETYQEVYPFYQWLIVNIPQFTKLTDSASEVGDHP